MTGGPSLDPHQRRLAVEWKIMFIVPIHAKGRS